MKHCLRCEQTLPVMAFNHDRRRPDGLASYCRECYSRYKKESYWRNPEAHRARGREKAAAARAADPARINARNRRYAAKRRERKFALLGGAACVFCGATENIHLDHIIPKMLGGTNGLANRMPVCSSCNISRSDQPLLQWIRRVAIEGLPWRHDD
jgi:5-methylcytosine-specific restriction endonuclease McrA